jgi:hypothetical protein
MKFTRVSFLKYLFSVNTNGHFFELDQIIKIGFRICLDYDWVRPFIVTNSEVSGCQPRRVCVGERE